MAINPNPMLVTKQGGFVTQPFNLIVGQAAPTSALKRPAGTFFLNEAASPTPALYASGGVVNNLGIWILMGGGSGEVLTVNSLSPVAGNINIVGTAQEITVSNAGSTVTLGIPDSTSTQSFVTSSPTLGTTFTANSFTPTGSDANIPLLVNGKGSGGVVHSRGIVGGDVNLQATNTDNTNSASSASVQVAVGGTSAGDPKYTVEISTGKSYGFGIDNSTTNDNFVLSDGGVLGTNNRLSISGLNGDLSVFHNLIITTAGHQLRVNGGAATDFIGQATLVAGTVTVANTNIDAGDRILVTRSDLNGSTALGVFDVSITPSTSFTIDSRKPADATIETNDISVVDYFIVREI